MKLPWLTTQLMAAQPIQANGLHVTPYTRVLRLTLPGWPAGLVWVRPGWVEVSGPSGATRRLKVRDVTREVLVSIWTLGVVLSLGWWTGRQWRRRRKRVEW